MSRRVVGVIRVSRMRDSSTSPEEQERQINDWCRKSDHLVDLAKDKDVSGKTVSPWDRPELGHWLARPHLFDVLVATKLDRVCRSAEDFLRLVKWAKDNNVIVVFIKEGIDLSTTGGELAAKFISIVAEWDWERIRENTVAGQNLAIQQGRFKGGYIPIGYRTVKETRNGITGTWLVIDEDDRAFVRAIIERVVSGKETLTGICADLTASGELTAADRSRVKMGRPPKDAEWRVTNLIKILRSRSLLGEYHTKDDTKLRDETGIPIAKAEPLVTTTEFAELQRAMDKISYKKIQNRTGNSMLQGVLFCGPCTLGSLHTEENFKHWKATGGHLDIKPMPMWHMDSRGYSYYRCSSKPSCGNAMASAGRLEDNISKAFENQFKDDPMVEEVVIPGEDHSADIAALEEKLENLTGNLGSVKPGSAAATATLKLIEDVDTSLEALRALPTVAERVTYRETGEMVTDVWRSLSDDEKGQFLRNRGVRIMWMHIKSEPDGGPYVMIAWGSLEQVRDALRQVNSPR